MLPHGLGKSLQTDIDGGVDGARAALQRPGTAGCHDSRALLSFLPLQRDHDLISVYDVSAVYSLFLIGNNQAVTA